MAATQTKRRTWETAFLLSASLDGGFKAAFEDAEATMKSLRQQYVEDSMTVAEKTEYYFDAAASAIIASGVYDALGKVVSGYRESIEAAADFDIARARAFSSIKSPTAFDASPKILMIRCADASVFAAKSDAAFEKFVNALTLNAIASRLPIFASVFDVFFTPFRMFPSPLFIPEVSTCVVRIILPSDFEIAMFFPSFLKYHHSELRNSSSSGVNFRGKSIMCLLRE